MKPLKLTKDNFNDEVNLSDKPVLIDFYADWCGPCKMLAPTIEQLASEINNAKICKVNVDEQNELASSFGIMSIPTIVVIKNGKIAKKSVGLQSKESLISMINA